MERIHRCCGRWTPVHRRRGRPAGFVEGTSLYPQRTRARRGRAPAGLSSGRPPRHRGPGTGARSCALRARAESRVVAMLRQEARRSARLGGPLQRRRGAQPACGERRICLSTGMCELFAGRLPASTAGDVAHTQVRNAPLQGGLSLGYFSLAKQREVTRSPQASGSCRSHAEGCGHGPGQRGADAGQANESDSHAAGGRKPLFLGIPGHTRALQGLPGQSRALIGSPRRQRSRPAPIRRNRGAPPAQGKNQKTYTPRITSLRSCRVT